MLLGCYIHVFSIHVSETGQDVYSDSLEESGLFLQREALGQSFPMCRKGINGSLHELFLLWMAKARRMQRFVESWRRSCLRSSYFFLPLGSSFPTQKSMAGLSCKVLNQCLQDYTQEVQLPWNRLGCGLSSQCNVMLTANHN